MEKFTINAKGHHNITSQHKSTFEITTDPEMTIKGDCIIGVSSDKSMKDLPESFKKKIANEDTIIKLTLTTENSQDTITGKGHPDLDLSHPTDFVCRKSKFTCNRTLMIDADKASVDLKRDLINDLTNEKPLKIDIELL